MKRWISPVVLVVVQAAAWAAFFSGGMVGVSAWLALLLFVPALGAVLAIVGLALTAVRRRLSLAVGLTLVLGIGAMWTAAWNYGRLLIAYPSTIEDTTPWATVRLPCDLPVVVAWGGDGLDANRHATQPDQRWAYDFFIEPHSTESPDPADYGCWGVPVLAPAAARVHLVHDGEPDVVAAVAPSELTSPAGNHVVLELDTGTYLILAHLKQHSVAVTVGERVEEGKRLGLCGNSGNTSEPHIHIHHQRQDPAHFSIGFAEGLPLFFRDHDGPPMPEGGVTFADGEMSWRGQVVRHVGPEGTP